jgi:hypothetical protein
LSGAWRQFFDDVLDYCVGLAERAEQSGGKRQRLMWYATLALLRCVASPPASAVSALRTRLGNEDPALAVELQVERVFDGSDDALSGDDVEPAAVEEAAVLGQLIEAAEKLSGARNDPKLALLIQHLQELLTAGFRPVVFCRYIATARYVTEHLRPRFADASVAVATGESTPAERRRGEDNPVDGFILRVILRKAETIRKELGVLVPMPDDDQRLTQAMLKVVLLRRRDNRDRQLDLELFAGTPGGWSPGRYPRRYGSVWSNWRHWPRREPRRFWRITGGCGRRPAVPGVTRCSLVCRWMWWGFMCCCRMGCEWCGP